jgi:hypothetical protein
VSYRRENDDPSVEEPKASNGQLALIFIALMIFFLGAFVGIGRVFHWLFSYLF